MSNSTEKEVTAFYDNTGNTGIALNIFIALTSKYFLLVKRKWVTFIICSFRLFQENIVTT